MKTYLVKVIAYELVTVEARNDEQAIEKAGEAFGNNIEISHETHIVESSVEPQS